MKGKHENFRGTAVIAFVDILGFTSSINSEWGNEKNDPVNRLLEISNEIENVSQSPLNAIYIKETKEKLIEGGVKVITMSDSFILLYGLEKTDGQIKYLDFLNGFLSVIVGIKTIWERSIEMGYTIRGAMTTNEIFWDNKSNLIGPGLIEAYKLESEIAITSRIVLSKSLRMMFYRLISDLGLNDYTESLLSKLLKDADGQIILHPVKLLSEVQDLEPKVIKMAANAKNGKIGLKYISLLANFDSKEKLKLEDLNR